MVAVDDGFKFFIVDVGNADGCSLLPLRHSRFCRGVSLGKSIARVTLLCGVGGASIECLEKLPRSANRTALDPFAVESRE